MNFYLETWLKGYKYNRDSEFQKIVNLFKNKWAGKVIKPTTYSAAVITKKMH